MSDNADRRHSGKPLHLPAHFRGSTSGLNYPIAQQWLSDKKGSFDGYPESR